MRRLFLLLAAAVIGALLLPVNPAAAAGAPRCHQEAVKNPDGSITYHLVCQTRDPGNPGTPGGGGPAEDCGQDQANLPYEGAPFCYGGIPCQYTTTSCRWRPRPRPAPQGQKWQVLICYCADGTKTWVLTGGTSPAADRPGAGGVREPRSAGRDRQAQSGGARDRLAADLVLAGTGIVRTADRQLGRGSGRGRGAGRHHLEHRRRRLGHLCRRRRAGCGGVHAHVHPRVGTLRRQRDRTWRVHYEQGGNPIGIPGAPVTLTADTAWALSVAEAQVLTGPTPNR